MNKNDILKKFKSSNSIKRTIINFKTNEDLKQELLNDLKSQNLDLSLLKEDDNNFYIENYVFMKTDNKPIEILNKLPFDIKGTSIKEYSENTIKTDFAIYELI